MFADLSPSQKRQALLIIVVAASRIILNRALVRMTEAMGSAIFLAAWRAVGSLVAPENTLETE